MLAKVMMAALAWVAATPAPAEQAAVPALEPIGKWTIHYADDRCVIEHSYGQQGRATILALLPSVIDGSVQVRLSEPDPSYVGRVDPGTLTLHPSGKVVEVKLNSFGPSTDNRRITSFTLKDVPAAELLQAETIVVRRGRSGGPLMINTGGSATAAAALMRCQDELLTSYGIDAAALHRLSQLPRPVDKAGEAAWFKPKDYPKEALSHFRGGRAMARETIGVDGRVSDCKVVVSAGNSALDERTCAILRERGRYQPALDLEGRPMAVSRLVAIVWFPYGWRS